MVTPPRLTSKRGLGRGVSQVAGNTRHLDGSKPSVKAFVPALQARAFDGLLECVARQHAENNRHAGIHLRELQAARRLRTYISIVSGLSAQDAADGNERLVAARGAELP